MKKIITMLFFSFCIASLSAQMYSEPKKTEVKKEKPNKNATKKDTTSKPYLGIGFIINANIGLNRCVTSGNYTIKYPKGPTNSYATENSFGYRIGIGIGFQSRSFGLELPVNFNVDFFKVPSISTTDKLMVPSIEFGLNQYWRFLKEKHYIMIGEYFALNTVAYNPDSPGLYIGYGFIIMKRLSVSLRFKLGNFGDNTLYQIDKDYGYDGKVNETSSTYNTVQLLARYDLINTRKMKTKKKKEVKVKKDDYEYLNSQNNYNPPPVPTKAAVDYSGYSDSDLNLALKEANSKSDLDAMLGIQKELDKRKQVDEFSKFSYVQLEQELNKSLDKEDYKRADMIKKEMAKRDTQKGMPSENKGDSLESKSIEELQKLKDEAVQKEDYDKAKQIQDIINKKKP